MKMIKNLAFVKNYLSFVLCFTALLGTLALGYLKEIDVGFLIPAILGVYVSGRTTEKVMTIQAAANDPTASTEKVIGMVNGQNVSDPK